MHLTRFWPCHPSLCDHQRTAQPHRYSMKHFSQGKPSKEWLESLIQNRLNNRTHYKQNLIDTKLEFEMFTEFSRQLWHLDVSKREQTYYLLKFLKLKKLGFFNTLKAIKKIINILFY